MYNILCVDDVATNLFILKSIFDLHPDKYKITTVDSGEKALESLLFNDIDLILLDVMMPGLNGFETAQLIQKNKKTKNIPIIFLTAKKDKETIKDAFTFGVDYLSKPYDRDELFSRIETQLKLIDTKKELSEQLKFTQSILDNQSNIVLIHSNNEIVKVNKSFLDFFNVTSLEKFIEKNTSLVSQFSDFENYFTKELLEDGQSWVEYVYKSELENEHYVLLMDEKDFEPKSFQIDINKIKKTDKYVITLSDITKLKTTANRFENKATYDALTNIYNRSKFNEVFTLTMQTAISNNHNLCFAIMDIDFFKKVNDTYGHIVGDETLITFAQTITEHIRTTDTFARWGGEEFVLSLPGTSIDIAYTVVDKLRQAIEDATFKEIGHITCSVGLTQLIPGDEIDDILIRSDEALYEAKDTGRNKVCVK